MNECVCGGDGGDGGGGVSFLSGNFTKFDGFGASPFWRLAGLGPIGPLTKYIVTTIFAS